MIARPASRCAGEVQVRPALPQRGAEPVRGLPPQRGHQAPVQLPGVRARHRQRHHLAQRPRGRRRVRGADGVIVKAPRTRPGRGNCGGANSGSDDGSAPSGT